MFICIIFDDIQFIKLHITSKSIFSLEGLYYKVNREPSTHSTSSKEDELKHGPKQEDTKLSSRSCLPMWRC